MDPPGPGRKQHRHATPLVGIVLLPVLLLWQIMGSHYVLAAATAMVSVLGYLDDRRKVQGGLLVHSKTIVLALAAMVVAAQHASPLQPPFAFCCASLLAFVLVNATNFLDNTNGVCASITAASLLTVHRGNDASGFAALGFLCCNWPRALVFLGDAGAYALGLCVADAALGQLPLSPLAMRPFTGQIEATYHAFLSGAFLLLPFMVQLVDFTQVLCVRLWLGSPPWVGDQLHLTHRVERLGLPRVLVAPLFGGTALALGWCFA